MPVSNRVSAKILPQFIEDLTPAEEYQKQEAVKTVKFMYRPRGSERPTNKKGATLTDREWEMFFKPGLILSYNRFQ